MSSETADITFVLFTADDEPFRRGLDLERIGVALLVLGTDAVAKDLASRPRSRLVSVEQLPRGLDLSEPEARLRLLADRAERSVSDHAAWCWLDTTFLTDHISLELLYAGFIAGAVRADLRDGPVAGWHAGYDHTVLLAITAEQARQAGGPAALQPILTRATELPGGIRARHRNFINPSASVQLAVTVDVPTIQIFGDSHALGFTPSATLGQRSDILVATQEVSRIPVPYAYQFTHHHGPLTMHRLGRSDDLATERLAERGARAGDLMLFVAGEIDVRCHIVRQQHEVGRLLDEVVETLSATYVTRLIAVARHFPGSPVVLCGVTPPFDGPGYGADQKPIFGTLAERVNASRRLNAALARRALVAGLYYFDAYDDLAGADGTLPIERSDLFCHVGRDWKHLVTDRLYRMLSEMAQA